MNHGAQPTTKLYSPGNSQPHKVTTCAHSAHGNGGGIDVHALKGNPSDARCAGHDPKAPARETSSASTPHSSGRAADPSTPKSGHTGSSSTRTRTRTAKPEANGGVLTAVRVEPK